MNKLLRKYKKPLLVVGGTLLMISFAMSGTINQMGSDPSTRVVAVTNQGKITAGEQAESDADFKAVQEFLPFLLSNGAMRVENGTHFQLLAKEAALAGFLAGANDGQQWIEEIKQIGQLQQEAYQVLMREWAQRQQTGASPNPQPTAEDVAKFTSDRVNELAQRSMNTHRMVPEQFFLAVAKARAINRYVTSFQFAPRVSDRRLARNVTSEGDFALVDALVIPAERVLAKVAEPTSEELQAQFEKFKATKPGEGELGAGYFQPTRFKLEWLRIDRAAAAKAIDLDPIEVNKRYKSSRIKYAGEFAAEKANVERDLRDELTARLMTDADRVVRAEMLKVTARLTAEAQYKQLPADWDATRPTLEAIAQAVVRDVKMPGGVGSFPLPMVVSKGAAWLKPADIMTLPEIGSSELRVGTKRAGFAEALFLTRELGFPNELSIQRGVPYVDNPLTGPNGDRFYFTVLDVKKEGPAESLDECRDDVVRDVKLAKGLALLKGDLDRFRAMAVEKGLDAVAAEFPASAEQPAISAQKGTQISRTFSSAPELNTPDIRDTIMALATRIDPTKEVDAIPAVDRTMAAALSKTPAVLVAVVTAHIPATIEVFRRGDFQLMSQLINQELSPENTRTKVFSYAAMRQRMNYAVTAPGGVDESGETEPVAEPTTEPATAPATPKS